MQCSILRMFREFSMHILCSTLTRKGKLQSCHS